MITANTRMAGWRRPKELNLRVVLPGTVSKPLRRPGAALLDSGGVGGDQRWSRMQDSNPRGLFTRQVLCLLS